MVRPFFRWMVSALAAAQTSSIHVHIVARLVTRNDIEAHSSNRRRGPLRDESVDSIPQIPDGAGLMPRDFGISTRMSCGLGGASARTRGVALSAIEQCFTRSGTCLPRA